VRGRGFPGTIFFGSARIKARSSAEYEEYPGRSHYTLDQEGSVEVVDYALDWATH
jgi:hypothetical protein